MLANLNYYNREGLIYRKKKKERTRIGNVTFKMSHGIQAPVTFNPIAYAARANPTRLFSRSYTVKNLRRKTSPLSERCD